MMLESVNDKLNAYSTRAQEQLEHETRSPGPRPGACLTAAAGATLALASGADADIIYSGPQNLFLPGSVTYAATAVNIDGVGPADFNLRVENFSTMIGSQSIRNQTFAISGSSADDQILATMDLKRFSSASLIPGFSGPLASQSGELLFRQLSFLTNSPGMTSSANFGNWAGVIGGPGTGYQLGFLGVQVGTGGDVNYGWIQVAVTTDSEGFMLEAEIIDWAYETEVNTPIPAGAIPEASSLGLLAAGAAGLAALRRFRKRAATS